MKKSLVIIIGLLAALYLPMIFPWVCLRNDMPGVLDVPSLWVHHFSEMNANMPIRMQLALWCTVLAGSLLWFRFPSKKSFFAMLAAVYLISPAGILFMAALTHM